MKHIGKIKTGRFYAFALNEFRYRRVIFSRHHTQEGAEAAAYELSGQKKFSKTFAGDRCPESDLSPQVIAGLNGLESWAKECNYDIDWSAMTLIYTGER